jgi:hypothetical protein
VANVLAVLWPLAVCVVGRGRGFNGWFFRSFGCTDTPSRAVRSESIYRCLDQLCEIGCCLERNALPCLDTRLPDVNSKRFQNAWNGGTEKLFISLAPKMRMGCGNLPPHSHSYLVDSTTLISRHEPVSPHRVSLWIVRRWRLGGLAAIVANC